MNYIVKEVNLHPHMILYYTRGVRFLYPPTICINFGLVQIISQCVHLEQLAANGEGSVYEEAEGVGITNIR